MLTPAMTRLFPVLSPPRAATLAGYLDRVVANDMILADYRARWADVVEQLSTINVSSHKNTLIREWHNVVGRLQRSALALRDALEHLQHRDLTDAIRSARAAKTDSEFDAFCGVIERELIRCGGQRDYVEQLAADLQKDLDAIERAGEDIFATAFVVSPPVAAPSL